MGEKDLCDAALEGNDFPFNKRVKDELGGRDRTVTDLHKGQVAEEEIHGGCEPFAGHDGHHDEAITQHDGCVHEEENHRNDLLHVPITGKSQENDFSLIACRGHVLKNRTRQPRVTENKEPSFNN